MSARKQYEVIGFGSKPSRVFDRQREAKTYQREVDAVRQEDVQQGDQERARTRFVENLTYLLADAEDIRLNLPPAFILASSSLCASWASFTTQEQLKVLRDLRDLQLRLRRGVHRDPDCNLRGEIIGPITTAWEVYYDGRRQGPRETAANSTEAERLGRERIAAYKAEWVFASGAIYPDSDKWEIRIYE